MGSRTINSVILSRYLYRCGSVIHVCVSMFCRYCKIMNSETFDISKEKRVPKKFIDEVAK